ncbi:glycoside hydrolase domain-containing protein [Nocardia wallacei]|uniref:glycoside hydrolase domain-containing protein n=1 Tax=Nocardia wallacei TaxID=480035 RepID=UPI002453D1F2|nr:glycoside hydrolase domain-containing protein [Nocardia wallacei]
MATAVDFAARLIDPQAIKDAGHSAVLVYVSPSRPGANFGAKPVTREYCDQLKAVGLDIAAVWQYGKPNGSAPSDWTTGYDGGRRMAKEALERARAAGMPGWCPIYFAVDEDLSLANWNSTAVQFFRGCCDEIGRDWVGIYGSSKVCAWAIEDNVIGGRDGKRWAWQCRAWSNGLDTPEAVLYQRIIDTASNPGPKIDGSSVDVNDILAADFGQWSIDRSPSPASPSSPGGPVVVDKPDFEEFWAFGESNSSRWGARVRNTLWHTQEGGNGDPWGLANYLNNPANQVSYHDVIGNGVVVHVAPLDRSSWSVLDANAYTNNICFAGSRAAWSREQWLAREHDIKIACWLSVQYARQSGHAVDVIAPPYEVRDGISDHKYVTEALGIGNHTDLGWNFPWDVAAHWVAVYASGGVAAPVVNMIDQEAERAKDWIGARLTEGEIPTPDGEGRRAEFEHGHIYWHPRTGAHAIPAALFEAYAERGWEAGPLGYPIGDHTVLSDPDGNVWGDVQGFENGALYRRHGQPGFWVHGEIRARWNRSGFEVGPYGWPISDEIPFDTGSYQEFEHGRIYWTPKATLGLLTAGETDTPVADAA